MQNVDLTEFVVDRTTSPAASVEPPSTPGPAVESLTEDADCWLQTQPLFNPAEPSYLLKRERPEHRVIVYLKCQGLNYREIANRVGWTATAVGNICKQPWAQKIILGEITKAGRDAVEVLLNAEDLNSLAKLIDIRDDPETPKEVVRKCCNDVLDRKYGKPNQPITTTVGDPKTMSDLELVRVLRSGKSN